MSENIFRQAVDFEGLVNSVVVYADDLIVRTNEAQMLRKGAIFKMFRFKVKFRTLYVKANNCAVSDVGLNIIYGIKSRPQIGQLSERD